MKIQCPRCGQEYDVETSLIGQPVECFCGNKWIVEDREKYVYAAPVSKLTGADKLKVKQCPGCRKYYRVDF